MFVMWTSILLSSHKGLPHSPYTACTTTGMYVKVLT